MCVASMGLHPKFVIKLPSNSVINVTEIRPLADIVHYKYKIYIY